MIQMDSQLAQNWAECSVFGPWFAAPKTKAALSVIRWEWDQHQLIAAGSLAAWGCLIHSAFPAAEHSILALQQQGPACPWRLAAGADKQM